MIRLIAHRGNYKGKNLFEENKPDYILKAIEKGYDVELDIWNIDNKLYLGHDAPVHEIEVNFLVAQKDKFWCHAKNLEVVAVLKNLDVNWFWHESDKITLTSKGNIWPYIDIFLDGAVVNQPTKQSKYWTEKLYLTMNFYGICSDEF